MDKRKFRNAKIVFLILFIMLLINCIQKKTDSKTVIEGLERIYNNKKKTIENYFRIDMNYFIITQKIIINIIKK